MDANLERGDSQAGHGLSPVALRLGFVLAAAAAAFFFGCASAHADDTHRETPNGVSASHDSGSGESPDKQRTTLLPAPEQPAASTPEDADSVASDPAKQAEEPAVVVQPAAPPVTRPEPVEPAKASSDPTPVEPELPVGQEDSLALGTAETISSVTRGIERGVTPTLTPIARTTRELGRDLEPVIGRDSQLTRTVRDLETVTRNVGVLVEQATRPVEHSVVAVTRGLGLAPRGMTLSSQERWKRLLPGNAPTSQPCTNEPLRGPTALPRQPSVAPRPCVTLLLSLRSRPPASGGDPT